MKVHIEKIVNEDGDEKNLYLESDERQYVLKEYSGKVSIDKKTGKETELYSTVGYYPSIESAIRALKQRKIKESTARTLSELLEDVRRIDEYIRGLFESIA